MTDIKDSDLKELRRIQESIPKEWSDKLIRKVYITPEHKKAVDEVLRRKDLTEVQREKVQAIKDSGYFAQKEEVVNKSIEKKIKQYVEAEIEKSKRAGRLTNNDKKGPQE